MQIAGTARPKSPAVLKIEDEDGKCDAVSYNAPSPSSRLVD
jgi:hypothetical protein